MSLIELRPPFCIRDDAVHAALEIGEWYTDTGIRMSEMDGDLWAPGKPLHLLRRIEPIGELSEARSLLSWQPGLQIGIACRWVCRSAAIAGTHIDGPSPIPLEGPITLEVNIPGLVGGEVEIETCIVLRHVGEVQPLNAPPDGALLWSDGWSIRRSERTALLEGGYVRIPITLAAFSSEYPSSRCALWAVDVAADVDLEMPLENAVTIILNSEILDRDFPDPNIPDDEEERGNAALLPEYVLAGINVDLITMTVSALSGELEELMKAGSWEAMQEGSVGAAMTLRLDDAFGSVETAIHTFSEDLPGFIRRLRSSIRPKSWHDNKPVVAQ